MFCDRPQCKGEHENFDKKLEYQTKEETHFEYIICSRKHLLGHLGCGMLNAMKSCGYCKEESCLFCGNIQTIYSEFQSAYVTQKRTNAPFQAVRWRLYTTKNKFVFWLQVDKTVIGW